MYKITSETYKCSVTVGVPRSIVTINHPCINSLSGFVIFTSPPEPTVNPSPLPLPLPPGLYSNGSVVSHTNGSGNGLGAVGGITIGSCVSSLLWTSIIPVKGFYTYNF